MHRSYCASLASDSRQLVINDPDEVHHLIRVLRLSAGDKLELINGRGLLGAAHIIKSSKTLVEVELFSAPLSVPQQGVKIVLACALPKRSKFDDIIEKCTELGVDEIVPLVTERTEVAPSSEALLRMGTRFNKVALSASKQSKRLWFPSIHPVMRLEAAVDLFAKDENLLFIPWLEGRRQLIREACSPVLLEQCQGNIVFFIGPEGDFSPEEAGYVISKGALAVSLGETVLRVETAAIAIAAFLNFLKKC